MGRIYLVGLLLVLLAACDAPVSSGSSVQLGSATLIRSATVGPGEQAVTSQQATRLFTELCGKAGQGRAVVEAAAARNGSAQRKDTGTYFHQTLNLSVKLQESGRCSIVFVSKHPPQTLKAAFGALKPSRGTIDFQDNGLRGSEHYYAAFL